jgi:hypothetical protein
MEPYKINRINIISIELDAKYKWLLLVKNIRCRPCSDGKMVGHMKSYLIT